MTLTIRPAMPADARAIAELRVESWRASYRDIVPDGYLDAMRAEETLELWRAAAAGETAGTEVLVGLEDQHIVGFAAYGPAREPAFGYSSELFATYWHPHAIGKGHGSRMFAEVRRALARLGHKDMILWVLEANRRGRNFYESRMGGTFVEGSLRSFEIDGREIPELAYGFRPLNPQN